MTGNKWFPERFPEPFPSLAEVETATDDLFAAETKTLTRVVDSADTPQRDRGLRPRRGDGAAYEFQYSLDGGRTWLATARVIAKNVTGNWSQTIAIIVE